VGKSSKRRPGQVAEIVRQVLAEALAREIRDPRVGLVTLTRVEVSGDLSHAQVYVMVNALGKGEEPGNGEDEEKGEGERALEGLRSAAGFLRTKVAKALSTRTIPELHFELDRGLEHAARINAVLADLKREGED
jgi:ribosome-binding factor A